MLIPSLGQRLVTQPAVGMDYAAAFNHLTHKGHQAFRRSIRDRRHPNAPDTHAIFLSGYCNQRLGFGLAAPDALLDPAQVGLIHLHTAAEAVPSWSHHSAAQLVQPTPGRLVAAQSQHTLQPQGAGPVLLAGHPPHGPKPQGQRFARVLEDRARRHRSLPAAACALPQHFANWPRLVVFTPWAAEPLRPAHLKQVVSTGLLGSEPRFELGQIARIILHSRPYYILGSPESSKYPVRGIQVSRPRLALSWS